jgi:KipI family sensor histidine kinase inhibitor
MTGYQKARYLVVGERGISVEFGNALSEEINREVQKMLFALKQAELPGIVEAFPTIRSLFVYYDPLIIDVGKLIRALKNIEARMTDIPFPPSSLFEIPCIYGGEYGPDLDPAAEILGFSPEEIIDIHSGKEYFIYDTGFIGGSAHFKVPPPLDRLTRKKTPNLGAPQGAVLIAGGLGSAFKTIAAPTGWYWIGTSPLRGWFPEKNPPLLINPGDKIIYRSIDEEEFKRIKEMVDDGRFLVKTLNEKGTRR